MLPRLPAPPAELRPINPQIWAACHGASVTIPAVGSRVVYFPQGHAEQASSLPDFASLPRRLPFTFCYLAAVSYYADLSTDEVFAKISLSPNPPTAGSLDPSLLDPPPSDPSLAVEAFAKVLTPSDSNNGGGFSVPRFCAESILPPLDTKSDSPAQQISMTDVHGTVWSFRHIFRGSPRRHLLTTGWSKFVNAKQLVKGDSVVFIKRRTGERFLGIRRRPKHDNSGYLKYLENLARMAAALAAVALGGMMLDPSETGAIPSPQIQTRTQIQTRRRRKGMVSPESVLEAARLSAMNLPFEVLYYPKPDSAEFVVPAADFEAAMAVNWDPGMRVKMLVATEEARMLWIQGYLAGRVIQDPVLWPASPWRMLQVSWDEPALYVQAEKTMNPWQLIEGPGPRLPPIMPPNAGGDPIHHDLTPAGMQGARHDSCKGQGARHDSCKGSNSMDLDNHSDITSDEASKKRRNDAPPAEMQSQATAGLNALPPRAQNNREATRSIQLFGHTYHLNLPPHHDDAEEEEPKDSHFYRWL